MENPEASAEAGWWYRRGDESVGPVTEATLRQRARDGEIRPETLIWHERQGTEWKAFRTFQGGPLAAPSTDDPKWQEIFAKFDDGEGVSFKTVSILGFLFGPLYYFYLRLWRKGFAILGIYLCASAVLTVLDVGLSLPQSLQKLLGVACNAFCMISAKRDYWRFKRFDERMWPQLVWLDNKWRLAGLLVLPLVVITIAVMLDDEPETSGRTVSNASSLSAAARAGSPTSASRQELKDSWDPIQSTSTSERSLNGYQLTARQNQAAKNCTAWLQHKFGGSALNEYDANTRYTFKVDFRGGDLNRERVYFGNHLFMSFDAQMVKFTNGLEYERIDMPYHVCVLDDRLQVMNMESDFQAGIP